MNNHVDAAIVDPPPHGMFRARGLLYDVSNGPEQNPRLARVKSTHCTHRMSRNEVHTLNSIEASRPEAQLNSAEPVEMET